MSNQRNQSKLNRRIIRPLQALNFFMADMQAGVGPFLGIFLLAHGWKSVLIGSVMTIGGVAGMLMTAPAGALIDATKLKRLYVVIPGIFTVIAVPFVLITSPADHRLVRKSDQIVSGQVEIRAVVFGSGTIQTVKCRLENSGWTAMFKTAEEKIWSEVITVPAGQEKVAVTVEATDETGRPGQHTIVLAALSYRQAKRTKNGSNADAIGALPENGIFGTQLGPNRNAKPSSNPK